MELLTYALCRAMGKCGKVEMSMLLSVCAHCNFCVICAFQQQKKFFFHILNNKKKKNNSFLLFTFYFLFFSFFFFLSFFVFLLLFFFFINSFVEKSCLTK